MPDYGPGVIGDEEYDEKVAKGGGGGGPKYGPGVLDAHPAGAAVEETEPETAEEIINDAAGEDDYANLAEFREALEANPDKVAEFLAVEVNRDDGPRKGALQSLRKAEKAGEDRPDVLAMIDDALDALEG